MFLTAEEPGSLEASGRMSHAPSVVAEQVFFTRNGKVVGRRNVRLPLGGFYPTIGMMSMGEKVRVDLHPLSG